MKNIFIKALAGVMLTVGATSCGDKFLETNIYNGIDLDTGLNSVNNIGSALNGCYDRLYRYYFAGNYATNIGDIASDLAYWNGDKGHFNTINQFTYQPTDTYISYIWNYGYKVVDNSSRVIKACDALYADASASDKEELTLYKAEAKALRAYATLTMTNVYGHQIKVNGQDFSSSLGVVVVDEPVQAYEEVKRNTVGECYTAVVNDLKDAIAGFEAVGDREDLFVFGEAAAYGLLARTYLYMENYSEAITAAQKAISLSGITTLTYDAKAYKALYNGGASNTESIFALAITTTNNWSANSCGTLWSTYGITPTPYCLALYGEDDIRKSIMTFAEEGSVPYYDGGKFGAYGTGNPANATNYLINAPEMFLIQAEAYLKNNDEASAKNALLVVAKRNTAITSVSDLPSGSALMTFIQDERGRELFQEGHRLWDLRRWNKPAGLAAYDFPNIKFKFNNCQLADFLFPIPEGEINTGFGVEQNSNWQSVKPQ
ncbi:MAG: RagB/SusD family nutrient uptake outer membrane protein [Bacteroides sp.]|nr:RagB/SusD family nutrient uptake outer membrane protein [Bacteroides sp.]